MLKDNTEVFTNRPVFMNPNNHLLEIEEHMYILDDVKKPNVFRNMFPYSEVPKIPFNDRIVPHNMPEEISLFGIGERTGNTPLEAMVFEYAQLKGNLNGMDTTVITELAEYYEKEIGYQIPSRTPFVGKNFNKSWFPVFRKSAQGWGQL